jgi:hypothetical protein
MLNSLLDLSAENLTLNMPKEQLQSFNKQRESMSVDVQSRESLYLSTARPAQKFMKTGNWTNNFEQLHRMDLLVKNFAKHLLTTMLNKQVK